MTSETLVACQVWCTLSGRHLQEQCRQRRKRPRPLQELQDQVSGTLLRWSSRRYPSLSLWKRCPNRRHRTVSIDLPESGGSRSGVSRASDRGGLKVNGATEKQLRLCRRPCPCPRRSRLRILAEPVLERLLARSITWFQARHTGGTSAGGGCCATRARPARCTYVLRRRMNERQRDGDGRRHAAQLRGRNESL